MSRGLFPSPLVSHFFIRDTEKIMLTCRIAVGMELNNAREAPAGRQPGLQCFPGKDGSGRQHCHYYYCGTTTLDGGYFNSCPRPEAVNTRERMFPCWCMHLCACVCLSVCMHAYVNAFKIPQALEGEIWVMMMFLRLQLKCLNVCSERGLGNLRSNKA